MDKKLSVLAIAFTVVAFTQPTYAQQAEKPARIGFLSRTTPAAVFGADREMISEGTPVAAIEDERYRLQVDSAQAEVSRAEQSVVAAEIEFDKSLPAQDFGLHLVGALLPKHQGRGADRQTSAID